jgi:hypothetical protein
MAATVLAGPLAAQSVGVSRCNQLGESGTYEPGLLAVEQDGTRTFYPAGANGLTESIVFNRQRAFEWMRAQGIFPEGTVLNNYSGFICGLPCSDCPEDTEEYEQPGGEDPVEDPVEDPIEIPIDPPNEG